MASCLIRVEPRLRRLWKGDSGAFYYAGFFTPILCDERKNEKPAAVRAGEGAGHRYDAFLTRENKCTNTTAQMC